MVEGTLIHGTHRSADLIPAFLGELQDTDDYMDYFEVVPTDAWEKDDNGILVKVRGLCQPDEKHEFWDSEDATELVESLIDAINMNVPDGYYFGTTEGDGSDFGYWKIDDEDDIYEPSDDLDGFDEGLKADGKRIRESDDDQKYVVGLWSGSGYMLDCFGTTADSNDEALDKIVAYIIEKGYKGLYYTLEEVNKMREEDGIDNSDDVEVMDWDEKSGLLYIDATMEGADMPVYIHSENLKIREVDEYDDHVEVIDGEKLDESKLFRAIYRRTKRLSETNADNYQVIRKSDGEPYHKSFSSRELAEKWIAKQSNPDRYEVVYDKDLENEDLNDETKKRSSLLAKLRGEK